MVERIVAGPEAGLHQGNLLKPAV
ncbi:MAG: hypothetical protein K0R70_1003, partial [Steroidobacteraceae bacterium]|nr:hypothetical protein [Steroidobacteraceae bacterium]